MPKEMSKVLGLWGQNLIQGEVIEPLATVFCVVAVALVKLLNKAYSLHWVLGYDAGTAVLAYTHHWD
jgi:hypothetical protein